MEWTKRKLFIIYVSILLMSFLLGGLFNSSDHITQFEIMCENGSVERFNKSDLYICGGYENPLRKNIIDVNFTQLVEKIN